MIIIVITKVFTSVRVCGFSSNIQLCVCVCVCVCVGVHVMVPAGSHCAAGFHLAPICWSSREQIMQPSICASIQGKWGTSLLVIHDGNTESLCRLPAQPLSVPAVHPAQRKSEY